MSEKLRPCGHPLGTTRWCPDCELAGRAPQASAPSVQALTEDQIRRLWLEQTDNYAIAWKGALGLARAVERVIHAAQASALPAAQQPAVEPAYLSDGKQAFPVATVARWSPLNRAQFTIPLYTSPVKPRGQS